MTMTFNNTLAGNSRAYQDCPIKKHEFRLLNIAADDHFAAPLQGWLSKHPIDKAPKYFTLSYAWGNVTKKGSVQLRGNSLTISLTVEDALRTLRKLRVRRVWIDQICINQQHIPERNYQVTRMNDIYAHARQCFMHLPSLSNDKEARADASALCEWVEHFREAMRKDSGRYGRHPEKDDPWNRGSLRLRRARRCMFEIFQSSYFTRLWVLQEVVYSRKVTILWGSTEIPWHVLRALAKELPITKLYASNIAAREQGLVQGYYEIFIDEWKSFMQTTANEHDIKRAAGLRQFSDFIELVDEILDHMESKPRLLWLLAKSRPLQTTDPRDKIYALLSLASNDMVYPEPDYSLTTAEVYQKFAQHLSRHGCAPCLLASAGLHFSSSSPTWIPDWTDHGSELSFETDSFFQAGGGSHCRAINANANVLRLEAGCCDYIDEIYGEKPSSQRLFKDLGALVAETSDATGLEIHDLVDLLFCDPERDNGKTFGLTTANSMLPDTVVDKLLENKWVRSQWNSQKALQSNFSSQWARGGGDSWARAFATTDVLLHSEVPFTQKNVDALPWLRQLKQNILDISETEAAVSRRARIIAKSQYRDIGYFNFLRSEKTSIRVFRTHKGRFGWAHSMCRPGDRIALVKGARAPFVFRKCGEGQFQNFGQAYVRGIMMGEVLEEGSFQWKVREIV